MAHVISGVVSSLNEHRIVVVVVVVIGVHRATRHATGKGDVG